LNGEFWHGGWLDRGRQYLIMQQFSKDCNRMDEWDDRIYTGKADVLMS
jgi:hypothetical protein